MLAGRIIYERKYRHNAVGQDDILRIYEGEL